MSPDTSEYVIRSSDCDVEEIGALPTVSLCIPTLNDGDTLERSLSSMRALDYPNLEIIVIDGHSEDDTVEIAERFADKVIYDDNNYGSACQRGFQVSSGEIVGLFDGDIYFPNEGWLMKAVEYFDCGDNVSTVWPQNVAPPESGLLTHLYFDHWKLIIEHRVKNERSYFGGGNSLFLRSALEDIGGINDDIHWGADFDWAQRLYESGYQVVYFEDPVYHHTMRDWSQFYSKQFSGAETFSQRGFGLLGMDISDVLYEQYVLGLWGMIRGLFKEREISWALFPVYIVLRSLAYGYTFIRSSTNRQ